MRETPPSRYTPKGRAHPTPPIGIRKSTGNLRLRRLFVFGSPSWGALFVTRALLTEHHCKLSITSDGVRIRRCCWPHISPFSGALPFAGGVAQAPIRNSRGWRFMRILSGRSTHPARVHSLYGPLVSGGSGVDGTPVTGPLFCSTLRLTDFRRLCDYDRLLISFGSNALSVFHIPQIAVTWSRATFRRAFRLDMPDVIQWTYRSANTLSF
jgi:hypothetical protein